MSNSQEKNKKLRNGMESTVDKFMECAKQKNDDIFRRISPDLKNNTFLVENVKWHKLCYSTYTTVMRMLNITLAHNMTLWYQSLQHPLRDEVQSWLQIGTCVWFASRLSVKESGILHRLLIYKSVTHWWMPLNAEMTGRWWWGFEVRISHIIIQV